MGYRIWNPVTRSIIIRRDVKFFENALLRDHSEIQNEDVNQEGIDLTVGLHSPEAH